MRRLILPLLVLAAVPASASAQVLVNRNRESLAIQSLSDPRRLMLFPNQSVGFRVLGDADGSRTLRVTTGHLESGRLYHAVARIVPQDGSAPRLVEGTVSTAVPTMDIGELPAGAYVVTVHLEDFASGVERNARSKVVLR